MKTGKTRERRFSFIISFTVIACVCYLLIMWIHLQTEINQKQAQYESLSVQHVEQEEENAAIDKQIREGISDEELEQIAREELGYVMPGEHVYADASAGE